MILLKLEATTVAATTEYVAILHNQASYREPLDLKLVYECQVVTDGDSRHDILEGIFELFNIGGPSHPVVRDYREAGLRSLSIDDVVVIGRTAYSCDRAGWTPYPLPSEAVRPA